MSYRVKLLLLLLLLLLQGCNTWAMATSSGKLES
jgi:predicted small secreted protein